MATTIHVDIVSAEEAIFSGPAERVFASAIMGEVGILPSHTPFLTQLKPGEVRVITPEGEENFYYVSGGMLEVQPHAVTILSDTAVRAHDIDEAAAIQAKEEAERALQDRSTEIDYAQVQIELAQAVAQLSALKRLKGRR
ncbi:MAG: F0F1 ATP synthase subunit epsilon [Gammaproteobacteria bacterium]|nr:F0F1 ATP synthase subunit epsilon [Gammaproteobacteria bacterium]